MKIKVENNGVETIIDSKIYTIWGHEAFSMYLSIITGMKNRGFDIGVNGLYGMINGRLDLKNQK